jgi:hypothetical protein
MIADRHIHRQGIQQVQTEGVAMMAKLLTFLNKFL